MAETERLQPTDEVLKSRRNLIALSFVVISILTINPPTVAIKDWGLEIGIANSIPVKILLLFSLVFQLAVYYSRFNVRDFYVRLTDRHIAQDKLRDRIKNFEASLGGSTQTRVESDPASGLLIPSSRKTELAKIILDLEESKSDLEQFTKKIFKYHVTMEVTLPCYISAFSIYWCTLDIVRLYAIKLDLTELINMQPFTAAVIGITVTATMNYISRKFIFK